MRLLDTNLGRILAVLLAVAEPSAVWAAPAGRAGGGAHTLRLAEFAFDPVERAPSLPAGWDRSSQSLPDLHLVQFDGPIPGEAPGALRAAGLEIVQYVFPDTYIVWGKSADRERMRGRGHVRWTGDFAPAYRVQPPWRERSGEVLDVRVIIYRGAGADGVVEALSKLGAPIGNRTIVNDRFEVAGLRISGALMRFAAAVPGIYSIQPIDGRWAARAEVSDQININYVDESNIAYPGYGAWLSAFGLDGAGATVAIVDEGVDATHPDLAASARPCVGSSCTTAPSIHGTHVAGIVTGDGVSGTTDAAGFLRGLGVAPGAAFIQQEFIMFRYLPGGVRDLMAESVRNGATISNNSWGTADVAQGYNADAMMIDAGVRDADPVLSGNQPLVYVQAFGNGNGGVSSQGSPDEAKNVIVVGSTWSNDSVDGSPSPDIDSVSSNSAHGPALDGRQIPHLVAPGCFVDSTEPNFGGGYEFGLLCGTSMAAPQVSGAAAIFRQYYKRVTGSASGPSPALTKAALLATARNLAGNHDADGGTLANRPDSKQGWGRLDLGELATPIAGTVLYYDQARTFEETGEAWLREVVPVDPTRPMGIFLAWTDAPGPGLGGTTPGWANDLDLVVEAGGGTYRGNVFGANGWSTTGGAADFKNNAEGVFLQHPPASVTIRVVASNLNSDGVPGVGDAIDQDFALVCANCAYAPGFDLDPSPVTRDVCAPAAATYAISIEGHSGFDAPVALAVGGLPASAISTFDVNPVVPGAASTLTLDPGGTLDGDYTLALSGDAAGVHRSDPLYLRVRRAVPAGPTLTAPPAGATNVASQPLLAWAAVPWAASYVVEVAKDPSFQTIAYSAWSGATSHKVAQILEETTTYYWRVRARNACGFGAFSPVSSFTTRNVPDVLLVDDDWDYWGDFQATYRAALDALPLSPYFYPVTYDVWDVYGAMQQKEPDYASLALYKKVVWWSGNEDFYAGPSYFSELSLSDWFRLRGGCFLLSSADYVFQRGTVSDFMKQRLGVASVVQDTGQGQVTGQGSVFGALGTVNLKNLSSDYSDRISPDATAELAYLGNQGNAGVDKNGAFYRSAYVGFGMERLFATADRSRAILKFLQWCDGLAGVDGDGDGVANALDCVPGDATAWTTPSPVGDLRLSKGTAGFAWSAPASSGGAVYDLLRSEHSADFWNAECVAGGVPQTTVDATSDATPAPGQVFFYLVRARSACGTAAMGATSAGTPRQGTACR